MIGAPSRSYLPPSSARPLHDRLTRGWGIEAPRVALLMDPAMRPTRSLVLGVKRSDFPADAPVDDMVRMLLWYLPPAAHAGPDAGGLDGRDDDAARRLLLKAASL